MEEELDRQVQLAARPDSLRFRPEAEGEVEGSRKGHAMRPIYLQGVYSAVWKEVM